MFRGIAAGTLVVWLALLCAPVHAQYGYFYSGKNYGSEALFSPVNQVLSGGFDMVQVLNSSTELDKLSLGKGFQNVFESLTHPRKAIAVTGWGNFVRSEIIPTGFSQEKSQWIPNYSLHLLGGGMEYARLADFYEYYGYKNPRMLAFLTNTAEQLLNEAVEANDKDWLSYDAVGDFYFFNLPGLILFSFEPVQRFFSEEIMIRSWHSQISYVVTDNSIRNVGQFWAFKWHPEFMRKTSLFAHVGAGALLGAGYQLHDKTVSVGVGMRTHRVLVIDNHTKQETITTKPSVGVFIDKRNSLLASFVFTSGHDFQENIKTEIYPGFLNLPFKDLKLGFWINYSFQQQTYAGITIGWLPGLGF